MSFVTAKSGRPPAQTLCNDDQWLLYYGQMVYNIFPNAKFIFLIRNGAHLLAQFRSKQAFEKEFKSWNDSITKQNNNCNRLGSKICLKVYYEELIYKPKLWLKVISQFLYLKWEPNSVNQTYFINWSKKNLLSNDTYLWRDSYRNKIEETMKKTRI